ncbi:MAG: hypothetical protein K2G55_01010 [Lachnospiraceae bacterium]|nr:hypothetical protein [Lachnospiraceae bacterium]MDE7200837.1 hypothetical protein [Lachnospiraceae bacterium]
MRIGKSSILILCICMLGLTACGEVVQPENKEVIDELAATASSISIEKDGSISSTIVEAFSGSYYYEDGEEGLKPMIESSIDEYTSENAAAQIKLKSLKVKDGVVKVLMEYGDYQAYAGFNSEDFFAGTVRDANMAGFDLNVTLKSVSDNTQISKPELLGMGDSHIVIEIIENAEEADQIRVNCFDEILYISDGVTTVGKKSADVSLTDGYRIIVFK